MTLDYDKNPIAGESLDWENNLFAWLQDPGNVLAPPINSVARMRISEVFGLDADVNTLPVFLNGLPSEELLIAQLYFSGFSEDVILRAAEIEDMPSTLSLDNIKEMLNVPSFAQTEVDKSEFAAEDGFRTLKEDEPVIGNRLRVFIKTINLNMPKAHNYSPAVAGVNRVIEDFSTWVSAQELEIQEKYRGYQAIVVSHIRGEGGIHKNIQYWRERYPALPIRERRRMSGQSRLEIDMHSIALSIAASLRPTIEVRRPVNGLRNNTAIMEELFRVALHENLKWQEFSLCPQTDPEAFFPDKGQSTRTAKSVCANCEVREQCLEHALSTNERYGVWGGHSERERKRMIKLRAKGKQ